ncbi:MAG: 2-phosphosulfolactate phosphatase [Candidatus Glassbacteria bacterium]|nr:2-phosphosulfolactate phosphatase [Candidatus Glassbacteria bacterium]
MQIYRQQLLEGAAAARDTAVVIDVFRAFTCSAMLLSYGVERLLVEEDPARVLELKKSRGYLALGEIGGVMVEGFDLGNSPSEIAAAGPEYFRGRTVMQRTSAGVRGIHAAIGSCGRVFAAAYSTARAAAGALRRAGPAQVHLVAMGDSGAEPVPEDEECAAYLHHLLDPCQPYDHLESLQKILGHESARKFLRGDRAHYPPADVAWCLQRDIFPFAMQAVPGGHGVELKAVPAE